MAWDPTDIYDPRNNPYRPTTGFQVPPPVDPSEPDVPLPAGQESGVLGRLMEGGLGGLAYVGKVLDKTFGGRAVRGLLGGHPEELLSVLPMSDSLGITNEKNVVHGTDLLGKAGLINSADKGWENELAGVGAEMLLDPGTWVGSAVPKLVMGNLAKGAGAVGKNVLQPASARLGRAVGVDPYAGMQTLAGAAGRQAKAMFHTPVQGATSAAGQDLMENFYTPLLKSRTDAASENRAGLLEPLLQYIDRGQDAERSLFRGMMQHAEGYTNDAAATLGQHFNPAEVQQITGWAQQNADRMRGLLSPEQARGMTTGQLADPLRNPLALTPDETNLLNSFVADPQTKAQLLAKQAAAANAPTIGAEYFPRQIQPLSQTADEGTLPFLQRAYRQFKGEHDFGEHRIEELTGLPGGSATWNDWVKDPRLSGQNRTMTDQQVRDFVTTQLRGTASPPIGVAADNIAEQAKAMAERLKGLPEEYVKGKRDYYSMDFPNNAYQRELASAKSTTAADTAQQAIAKLAQPEGVFRQAGTPSVPVDSLLERMGLTGTDANGVRIARDQAAQALGIHIDDLKGMHLPADVANDMLRVGEAWKAPGTLAPVVQAWDYMTNLFKTAVTAPFPAFHVRNMMSGLFNQWRDGALSVGAIQDATRMQRGGSLAPETAAKIYGPGVSAEQASHQLLQEAMAHNVAFGRQNRGVGDLVGSAAPGGKILAEDIPRVGGQVRPFMDDVAKQASRLKPDPGKSLLGSYLDIRQVAGAASPEDLHPLVRTARDVGSTIEDNIRLAHYVGLRQQGIPAAEAALRVKKYQIDYSDLTPFERNVMKRVMPWYAFSRKNLPPMLEDLAKQPAKLLGSTRVITGTRPQDEFIPNYIAEGASVPIPGAEDGQQRFISSFGLPIEDEAVKTLGAALQGDPQRFFQQIVGMGQPMVKLPFELATGTQMFSGRKLEELRPYESLSALGLPEDLARKATQVIANTPASRTASTIDKFIDTRKGTIPTAINTLTGVRLQDVDTQAQQDFAARRMLQDMLTGMPNVRSTTDVYIPQDKLQTVDPYEMNLYSWLKAVNSRIEKKGREEKKAKAGNY